ncbi:MAG: hypothetical protein GQ526_07025 [Ardenticatenales bacterium]|nr:hypothetical protein [Ardenticatenales bacterium]
MTKDAFDRLDMDDLASQMKDAMAKAQEAMEDLPDQMGEMGDLMGSLSALMEGMPAQMEELTTAMAGLGGSMKRVSSHRPGRRIGQWKRAFGWEKSCTWLSARRLTWERSGKRGPARSTRGLTR